MAADAGLITTGKEIIAIAGIGTSGGADTAIVVTVRNTEDFFDMKIKEILRKPY